MPKKEKIHAFKLSIDEFNNWKSQFATSNYSKMALRKLHRMRHNVQAIIYTNKITPKLELDIAKHNAQYAPINIKAIQNIHDRFLITDDMVYHIGASIKDLGKKLFGFSLMKTLKVSDILKDR